MTPLEAAYLAGVVDGEGTVLITRIARALASGRTSVTYSPRLTVVNTDARLTNWCVLHGASLRRESPSARASIPGKREVHVAVWSTRAAVAILKAILPYLILKRRQAVIAIRLGEMNAANRLRRPLTQQQLAVRQGMKDRVSGLNQRRKGA
jgi:hypothetical protein